MLVEALARTPGTQLHAALTGDSWTLDQHLLALVHDQLAMANWQRQGKRGAKRPEPVSPLAKRNQTQRTGNAAGRDDDQMVNLLAAYRTGQLDRG